MLPARLLIPSLTPFLRKDLIVERTIHTPCMQQYSRIVLVAIIVPSLAPCNRRAGWMCLTSLLPTPFCDEPILERDGADVGKGSIEIVLIVVVATIRSGDERVQSYAFGGILLNGGLL
jgi:hypothetical protein